MFIIQSFNSQPKLITSAGYPSEKHRVTTEDGYILQMHRIPAGRRTARRSEPSGKGKKAVLVMHGMAGSSGDFVIMGRERSLGTLVLVTIWFLRIYITTVVPSLLNSEHFWYVSSKLGILMNPGWRHTCLSWNEYLVKHANSLLSIYQR